MNKRLDQLTKAELLARLKTEMANNHQKDGQLIQLGEAIATGAGCTYSHMEQIHA